jgi:ankyrin repeat protein
LAEISHRKKNLINELGPGGWNAFQFAIFFGHNQIVKTFLESFEVDINKKTTEGWNPLLLAINKNNFEVLKKI